VDAVLAHGIGGRSDLPVPVWLAMYAGAMAVLISFFAVVAFWPKPRLTADAPGRALPAAVTAAADAPVTRVALRLLGVAAMAALLAAAWFGHESPARNPAPTWFYVWFWVGLVPASILLGPVWRLVNPLRTLAGVLLAARGGRGLVAEPDRVLRRLGYWPAVAGVFAFVWLELVSVGPDDPRSVALFVTGYAVVTVAAAVALGPGWFARGDGFEAYATLLAGLSPFGRRAADGRLVLRNPLSGLVAMVPVPVSRTVLVLVVLGSTAFDGLSRTQPWTRVANGLDTGPYVLLGTAGLVASVGMVAAIFLGAVALCGPEVRAADVVHTLVPIAVGYTVAHYFSLVVFQGQAGLLLASDPLGRGWDLFGTADTTIDYLVVSTTLIAFVQVGAIVAGHVVGVVAAHDRAVAVLPRRRARAGQYPLVVAMVCYTGIGIGLLVGS
jgi:hypothetical protein